MGKQIWETLTRSYHRCHTHSASRLAAVWGWEVADWMEGPCWFWSASESTYNEHMSIKAWPCLLHRMDARVHVHHIPGKEKMPGCTTGRRQAGRGRLIALVFCLEASGSLTPSTYLNIVADQVTPLRDKSIQYLSHYKYFGEEVWVQCWLWVQISQICGMCWILNQKSLETMKTEVCLISAISHW